MTRRLAGTVLLTMALASGLAGCSGSGSGGSTAATQGVADFSSTVQQSGIVVVDVRTPSEFAAGHLPNALNIDVEAGDFAQRISTLDKNASYALYCRTGRRSGVALEQMTSSGFTHVVHLSGGIVAWTSDGRQLVTG